MGAVSSVSAQETVTATRAGPFQKSPSGIQLGTVLTGAEVTADSVSGSWRHITVEGWIFTSSTRSDRREGFDISVRVSPTENLRVEPNGTVIARLGQGALLERLATRGGWTRVRRSGWVPTRTFPQASTVVATSTEAAEPDTTFLEAIAETGLMVQPGGDRLGTLAPDAAVEALAQSGDWVRVRVEGWVHRDSLRSSAGVATHGVTAAEVRANPDRYVGTDLDWQVQFVAIQTADELRPEIPLGQRYLLTRGPAPETGFVYVVIDEAQLERVRALQPLEDLTIRVRILAPRTRYLPHPVVQLLAILKTGG